jgi:hypothetical protein
MVAGAVAVMLGRGGATAVARAAGMSRNTVMAGRKAAAAGEEPTGRVRREGGGRPRLEDTDPMLLADLDDLVEPEARRDQRARPVIRRCDRLRCRRCVGR